VVILNDWSARDLQAWEYVPLGPFLGKSFATSISAWVLPLAALEGAEVDPPRARPDLLPYLAAEHGYAIDVEVSINGHPSPPARTRRCTTRRPRCSPT
jgi:fumarylacetoacetase